MEEIKIWSVDGKQASPIEPIDRMELERDLEDILVRKPELLMSGLKLVGRQMQTGSGPLDLLGVDEEGKLVVFELKRGTLSRDAVAQVIDYASYLQSLEASELYELIQGNSGKNCIEKIENFEAWYRENPEWEDLESLRPVRMVLVGLGGDDSTKRMVDFLSKTGGTDIVLLTFQAFKQADKTLLARQVVSETKRKPNARERWSLLEDRAKGYGVHGLFIDVCEMFREHWQGPWGLAHRRLDLGLDLRPPTLVSRGRLRRRRHARIDPLPDSVRVVFYPRSIALCPNAFERPIKDIPFQTWPSSRESNALSTPGTEVQFRLTEGDWETHKGALAELACSVYEALQERNQGGTPSEGDVEDEEDNE